MECEPIIRFEGGLTVGGGGQIVFECEGPEDDSPTAPWAVCWPDEAYPYGVTMNDLRTALDDHAEAHPRDQKRPVRSATPKFRSGLGLTPGTRITEAK